MSETRSTCPYCGVGCGVIIEAEGNTITGVRGDPDHPANFGRLCTKGSTLHLTAAPHISLQVRALHPMKRQQRDAALERISWDDAETEIANTLASIVMRDGPDAIGLYLSGQLLTEDYYVFNKLGKGLIGTNNVDTNSRLCMSSAVAGYKASLGADAPPACYEDLALAHTVFITGSNTAWAHPVLFRRLEDAKRANPAQRWIVVDPRRTETAEEADLHLQIQPGTDVVLHHALLHLMLWDGLLDMPFIAQHTSGFEVLRDRVREFTPAHAAKVCGIKEADIVQAARWFAGLDGEPLAGAETFIKGERRPTLSLYCQGLNQSSSGTDKNRSLINLHLATGQIGKPGAGPFSLTGQPNAMGGREVGGLANLLSAHRDMANPQHRAEVAALWGVRDVPAEPGKSAVAMFEAAAEGAIKALWIVCTNPLQSLPDTALVKKALQRAELVIVQDAYRSTATAAYADYVLPASSWGEKDGTVTNSERRISRMRSAVAAPEQSRDDWRIAQAIAYRLERLLPDQRVAGLKGETLFPYADAESVWNEHRESTRGRDLDITGLSYAQLQAQPVQWPCPSTSANSASQLQAEPPAAQARGQARLYTDGRFATADSRAQFAAPAWRNVAEPRDQHYPVSLTTGRLRDQWHGMSRTGTLGRLFAHDDQPSIELHPQELLRRRLKEGDLVRVRSRRGQLVLPARASRGVAPAQAFIAMHWGPEWLAGGVNALMPRSVCPQSKQPELKHAAVKLEPAGLPWQVVAAAWLPGEKALALQHELQSLMQRFGAMQAQAVSSDGKLSTAPAPAAGPSRLQRAPPEFAGYASCVPFGREPDRLTPSGAAPRIGLVFRAALAQAPAAADMAAQLEPLFQAFGLTGSGVMRYEDSRHSQHRSLRLAQEGTLQAFLMAGDARSQAWVLELLHQGAPAAAFGSALLAGTATAPSFLQPRSPQVCACHDVSQDRIVEALALCAGSAEQRLAQLQQSLSCGSSCGSCLPALRGLVRSTAVAQAMPIQPLGTAAAA